MPITINKRVRESAWSPAIRHLKQHKMDFALVVLADMRKVELIVRSGSQRSCRRNRRQAGGLSLGGWDARQTQGDEKQPGNKPRHAQRVHAINLSAQGSDGAARGAALLGEMRDIEELCSDTQRYLVFRPNCTTSEAF